MRLVFAGTPEFARAFLQPLAQAQDHQLLAVYTQPDRAAGRGKKNRPSPVKEEALALGLPLLQPANLRDTEVQQQLRDLKPDLMIVAAYGLILPQQVLDIPRLGCINLHASLLPRWRGAAPIQRAILAGDRETGICLMKMDAGLDTGDVLDCVRISIARDDTAGTLHDRLIEAGRPLLLDGLARLPELLAQARPQDDSQATYADKIVAAEAELDWFRPAEELARAIRAFDPVPGAFSTLNGQRIKIWSASWCSESGQPGRIIRADERGLLVACGNSSLLITRLQLAGKKPLTVSELMHGHAALLQPGKVFCSGAAN